MKMRIEVPFSLIVFAFMFADSVTTNWMIHRTCHVTLGFNETICTSLVRHPDNSTTELNQKVQPYVTVISMTKILIEAFASALVCFFIGPWSDRYGRKPVFLLTFAGYTLAYLILAIVSAIPDLSPWFMLLYVVPICFSGGLMAIFSAVLSYISDITTPEKRGISMALFYAVAAGGILLGSMSVPFVLAALGYFAVYMIAACCIFLAWLLILLFVPESVPNPETEGKLRNLFKLSLVKIALKTTFMKRENNDRSLLLTIIAVLVVFLLARPAESCLYLYVQGKFHWTLKMFTTYSSVNTATETLGSIVGIYCFRKLLGVKESIVVLLGFCSAVCGALLLGLATKTWHLYAAGTSKCLVGVISPLSRSLVSKIVPSGDTGKVFASIAVCETLIVPLGAPLFTYIYNSTLSTFPQAFSFVTAGIYLCGLLLTLVVAALQRKHIEVPYHTLPSETSIN